MDTDRDLNDELRNIEKSSIGTSYENDLIRFLENVDDTYVLNDPQWEYYHGRLAGVASRKLIEMEDYIQEIEDLKQDVPELELGDSIGFQIFFALSKVHIQREEGSELRRLDETYGDKFQDHPLSPHLSSLSHRVQNGARSKSALKNALKATEQFNTHPGALNHLGIIIIERFEEGYSKIEGDNFPDSEEDILAFAEDRVREAIEYEPEYAIYHATLGRIVARAGRYSEARSLVQKAIKLEDREKADGPIRLSEYHRHLTEIDILEQNEEFERTRAKIEQAEEQVQEFQTRTLEFLGFFAALLTVAVTSVSISTGFLFADAARLILILIGGILIAFSGLGMILPRRKLDSQRSTILIIAIGMLLILIGFATEEILNQFSNL